VVVEEGKENELDWLVIRFCAAKKKKKKLRARKFSKKTATKENGALP
jgi:hypothetical protein